MLLRRTLIVCYQTVRPSQQLSRRWVRTATLTRSVATPRVVVVGTRRYSQASDPHVILSPFKDANIPGGGLDQFVWSQVENWPDHSAIVCGITGRGYTYRELRERCRRFASSLRRLGFEPGTVVGVILPNSPDYPVAVLGPVEAGLVVTTVNPAYTPVEISKQLVDANPRLLICLPESYPDVVEATRLAEAEGYKKPTVVIAPSVASSEVPQGALYLEDLVGPSVDVSNLKRGTVDTNTVAVIPYSSGTTGLPKGVRLSHRNIISNCVQIESTTELRICSATTKTVQDVIPAVLPFFHIYGLVGTLLGKLQLGVKIVTLPKFEAVPFLDTLKNHKATILYLVPPLILFLGASPSVTADHLKHCRFVVSGAAPIGEKDAERLLKRAPKGVQFVQGYGLTESSPVVLFTEVGFKKLASVGKVIPNTIAKIVDLETGASLGPGKVGEVCAQGPQVMLGYHNNPKATAEMIDQSGWMHTGDLGYYDDEHDFYIVERLKELIKVKGFQVAPAELEELLRTHPEVGEAAVIGKPDDRSGEIPIAFIVPKNSGALLASVKLGEDIQQFVASKLSAHKHLAEVRFVANIPKNPSGKILRKELRELVKKENNFK